MQTELQTKIHFLYFIIEEGQKDLLKDTEIQLLNDNKILIVELLETDRLLNFINIFENDIIKDKKLFIAIRRQVNNLDYDTTIISDSLFYGETEEKRKKCLKKLVKILKN